MNIWKEYFLPVVPVVMGIGFLLLAWLRRHRPFDLWRGLSICASGGCCFAWRFVREGWDKAAVAFLFIFIPTALIVIGRWSVLRHYQSTLPAKEPSKEVQS